MTVELPVAVLCANVILDERINPLQIAGVIIMLTAISAMNYYKSLKRRMNPQPPQSFERPSSQSR
jgi:drug/metabolite transporter (DMT)-like permease